MLQQDEFNDVRVWGPAPNYPLVKSVNHSRKSIIEIAGPCSIESEEQAEVVAKVLAANKIQYMRGGVYRAGTYPPHQLGDKGLQFTLLFAFHRVAQKYGLKNIVEVIDLKQLDFILPEADVLQVGARQMQNYGLLRAVSETGKPVTLKRHFGCTLDEFLGAAEYLLKGNTKDLTLIERGTASFMKHSRFQADITLIAALKRITGLPVLIDASHGTGRRDLVAPVTMAGLAAGADGYLIETHPNPSESISDSQQAYPLEDFPTLVKWARAEHKRHKEAPWNKMQ